MTDHVVNWTTAQIDAAIAANRKRQVAALTADDLATVADCESRIDRLLDARKHHAT